LARLHAELILLLRYKLRLILDIWGKLGERMGNTRGVEEGQKGGKKP